MSKRKASELGENDSEETEGSFWAMAKAREATKGNRPAPARAVPDTLSSVTPYSSSSVEHHGEAAIELKNKAISDATPTIQEIGVIITEALLPSMTQTSTELAENFGVIIASFYGRIVPRRIWEPVLLQGAGWSAMKRHSEREIGPNMIQIMVGAPSDLCDSQIDEVWSFAYDARGPVLTGLSVAGDVSVYARGRHKVLRSSALLFQLKFQEFRRPTTVDAVVECNASGIYQPVYRYSKTNTKPSV